MKYSTRFKIDPRDYALQLSDGSDDSVVSPTWMLQAALKWMSHDDVRDMLDANEISPRFMEDDDNE